MQDHKVFVRHNKFGTFQVLKGFLNTHEKDSAAVAPKAVRQARRVCMCSFPDTTRVARPALPDFALCGPI